PGSHLLLRQKASTNSAILASLSRGTSVKVLSTSGSWAKVTVSSKTGYVHADYLSSSKVSTSGSTSSSSAAKTVTKYVNVDPGSSLNMRTSPSTSASIITKLASGTVVQVLSEANGWAKVTAFGKTGYVSAQYLSSAEPLQGKSISKNYQSYGISLNEMVNIEMKANPQTDKKYSTYIRSDALIVDSKTNPKKGVVVGSNWNIRGGAGTNYWVVGKVSNGSTLQILGTVKGTDGKTWYKVSYNKTWVNASPEDVKYYVNPANFENDPVQCFQFLKLTQTANVDKDEINEKVLAGKGILAGKAESFITASKLSGVNELYLISHALLETKNGTSELANGVQYKGRTVYNMYGIGAYDGSAVTSGAAYAYNQGWFTPEAAIIGGAKFIESNYLKNGQDTLYKMRWNPSAAVSTRTASHQYATDIGWASKQVSSIYNLYSLLDSGQIILDIPKYQ
ncbi:SH3 domain-containing protein, partial [Weizmannia acidilactici]|uniref:SH3 domain-containing protein n=3 Tax=Weizmannia acidilactici TaxID=2607726 RepID=UPI00124DA08B